MKGGDLTGQMNINNWKIKDGALRKLNNNGCGED